MEGAGRPGLFSQRTLARLAVFFARHALPVPMKVSKSATRNMTLDPVPAHEADGDADAYPDDQRPDDEAETDAGLCPVCHDLLAWHEQACAAAATPPAPAEPADDAYPTPPPATTATFAFAIGHRVQPANSAPAAITWRGQHKERHPTTGLVQRINVYSLDNGYWDCYREEELQAA